MNPFQTTSHDSDIQGLTDQLARSAHRLEGPAGFDPLLDRIGEFFDQTQALHPLHIRPEKEIRPPETFPWGF